MNRECSIPSLKKKLLAEETLLVESNPTTNQRKPGWKAMPYILGNNTAERLANFGIQTNFIVYLMKVYNMDHVLAANIMNTWMAISNVVPLIGAFVADSYLGKFLTIAIASFASLIGLVILMLTAWVPQLHPTPCSIQQQQSGICNDHTDFQLWVLIFGLFWLSIGTGGIRPCSIPFAVDQFDLTTSEGRHGSSRFYNLYYTTQTLVMLINQTLLVYIEDSVSWTLGYGLFTMFMVVSIIIFFAGIRVYSYVQPEGSIFYNIAQVLVAARHKKHLHLPAFEDSEGAFYDPTFQNDLDGKLPLTKEFSCLNKAAIVVEENELTNDGSSKDPWRLCSIQQIEELKCMLKIIPIWVTSIIVFIPPGQLSIFSISQALKMDRNIGNFEIHAGSVSVITLIAIGIFLPFYDSVISPLLEKITKQEQGLTTLQRIGLGHGSAILSVVVAGLVEIRRRKLTISMGDSNGVAPMSVMWLAPQFLLIAFCHIFGTVGYTEFFNKESPNSMRSISNSLLCLNISVGSNLSTFIVNIVHSYTGKQGGSDWLDSDINKGRLEYFYFIIAGLAVLNLCYFIFCARKYCYKITSLKDKK
ncbi:protein NRT1/ PTR FAMILY 2.13-like [Trifolium pratense]|uniref:protein NRT1/ PTR FAMILY 2.13-like n=1 Tax=Trifolium pratense TaxID=57577 RepID=UPI001E693448|nr:protein NRT1/ PTR FAMILY 2.13-like [Trifolium pratense]XP_045805229.1 protein NRT1/ PTR FAMILY 2.13-like [Trifolium pratense]